MNDVLVLYESKTGYSKRYAEWIAEELNTVCYSLKEGTDEMFGKAHVVVFGGGVNGSILNGQSKFARKMKQYPDKKVIYFATGIRPATKRTSELIQKNNFGEEKVVCFYVRGGLESGRLTPGDKTLIRIYSAMIKRRRDIHEEDKEVISLLKLDVDYSTREQIQPLIQTVKIYLKNKMKEGDEYEQEGSY